MTITQPSQDPDKDSATLVWEGEATNAINNMQHQIDNINQTVVTSTPRVAIYSHTSDGTIQSFTPPTSGDGYVTYFAYTDELPTLPVSGLTFNAFSDDEIDFTIRQYIERAVKPTNPGTVTYDIANGTWLSSSNWTKTKLVRGATNVWYCEAQIVGTTGSITTKWGNPRLLYGGQTGSGILYYTTAVVDGSAPGKPLADGYDFESGAFTNLRNAGQAIGGTNGWSYTPITITISGADSVNKKHWQSVFNVEISELTEHTTQLDGGINNSVTTITVDSTAGFPIPSSTTLSSGINDTVETIPVTSTVNINAPFPDSGTLYIGSEQITYTAKTNTQFTGCTRGANSTSAASHSNAAAITTEPLVIYIGSEQITYTEVTNTTFTGCVRGANSTTAATHSDNDVVTTRLPVQVITFGTPTGFQPVGSNLQSDNFNGNLSNGTQGTAGWGISRTGNAIFNGVKVRGELNADDIDAGNLHADRISSTTINADNITTGDLDATRIVGGTLNITGLTSLQGEIEAPNLNTGVITQSSGFNTTGGNFTGGANGTLFTTLNNNSFDTDIIFYMGASATSSGNSQQATTLYLTVGGSTVGSCTAQNRTNVSMNQGKRVQVAKNSAVGYSYSGTFTDAENSPGNTFMAVSVVVFEIRRST